MKETKKASFDRSFWYAVTDGNPENLLDQDWVQFDANEDAIAWFEAQKTLGSAGTCLYLKLQNGNVQKLK